MKIIELLWWFFDIGQESTSPDIQSKTDQITNQQPSHLIKDQDSLEELDYWLSDEFEL